MTSIVDVELLKKNRHLIDVGICPLHVPLNGFLEGLKALTGKSDIELDHNLFQVFCKTFY